MIRVKTRKCYLTNLQPRKNVMSIPNFNHKLRFIIAENQAIADRDILMPKHKKNWYKNSFGAGKYLLMKKIVLITLKKEEKVFSNLTKRTVDSSNITLVVPLRISLLF